MKKMIFLPDFDFLQSDLSYRRSKSAEDILATYAQDTICFGMLFRMVIVLTIANASAIFI